MEIKIGEYVRTPRFLTVNIKAVLNAEQASRLGFKEPTHHKDDRYDMQSKSYLSDIFGNTEPLHINVTEDELNSELAAHGRDPIENIPTGIDITIENEASKTSMADVLRLVDEALNNEQPMYESRDIVAGIPLELVKSISAIKEGAEEYVFYRA